jgi:hypothetical protein
MPDLTLIDLYSQREAVEDYVRGWPVAEVLEWMRRFGTVTSFEIPRFSARIYYFRSPAGLPCPFYFRENGELVIITYAW